MTPPSIYAGIPLEFQTAETFRVRVGCNSRARHPQHQSLWPQASGDARDLPPQAESNLRTEAKSDKVDKPIVDPPELADRVRDTDKEPYWIPGAFPSVFQNETGDPSNYVFKEPKLETWGPHILRGHRWWAQTHMTFMY